MIATARILALNAFLIAATGAAPAIAAASPSTINILNGLQFGPPITNRLTTSNGLNSGNGLDVNGIAGNALHMNGVKNNALHLNAVGVSQRCKAGQPSCVQPAEQTAQQESAQPRFQGRSAKPLGDVGAAGTK